MGTSYRVTTYCPDARGLGKAAFDALLTQVNAEMSNYLDESELSRLNRAPIGEWYPISVELLQLLALAQQLAAESQGALDVTVGPLMRLWGFGPNAPAPSAAPAETTVAAALERTGMRHLALRAEPPAARRLAPIELDLSAIAKGHGVDRLAAVLEAAGCTNYLVDIGGELRARGRSARGDLWRVGVEIPEPGSFGQIARIVELDGMALATSGDYRNFVALPDDVPGRQNWSHTLDPRSGEPVSHNLASVTVAAPTAALADGWATALNVMGPDEGLALAQARGLAALLLVRTAQGFEERYTEAFKPLLVDPSP
jgi:thiamine biosynthesis lipoprotein